MGPQGQYSFFINDDPIENIFYLIKIHLASKQAFPNFSEDYKKTTKGQSLPPVSS